MTSLPGRTIRTVTGSADAARPLEFLAHRARWVPLGVFAMFVAVGLARVHHHPVLAVTAACVAVGAAALLVEPGRPLFLLYTGIATAGGAGWPGR